jgi:hypothetical protein
MGAVPTAAVALHPAENTGERDVDLMSDAIEAGWFGWAWGT